MVVGQGHFPFPLTHVCLATLPPIAAVAMDTSLENRDWRRQMGCPAHPIPADASGLPLPVLKATLQGAGVGLPGGGVDQAYGLESLETPRMCRS